MALYCYYNNYYFEYSASAVLHSFFVLLFFSLAQFWLALLFLFLFFHVLIFPVLVVLFQFCLYLILLCLLDYSLFFRFSLTNNSHVPSDIGLTINVLSSKFLLIRTAIFSSDEQYSKSSILASVGVIIN